MRDLPRHIECWPRELRERFEERAAILEFDGGLERAEAERRARVAIEKEHFMREMKQADIEFRGRRIQPAKTFAAAVPGTGSGIAR